MRRGEPNRKANIWTARFIPLFLIAIIGYCSWVTTKLVVVDYLLNPAPSLLIKRRVGPAIAILIIYYIILFILLVCYGRLVQTVVTNPGLVPRGSQWEAEQQRKGRPRKRRHYWNDKHSLDTDSADSPEVTPRKHRRTVSDDAYPTPTFWHKDVFVCNYDGRPRFCSSCLVYKVDRVHHCSELDRCVYKMDHFCPWVGGIVSETSFKYFIQFTFWTTLFTLHILVFTAYYFAERQRREGFINVHWILLLALSALFFIFGAGMCGSSLQFAFENTTTIENLSRRSHVWYLAIVVPERVLQQYFAAARSDLRLITYPRPLEEQIQMLQAHGADVSQSPRNTRTPVTPPTTVHTPSHNVANTSYAPRPPPPSVETRTFAILETKPGENPFDIGYFNNFREVMGYTVFDWLLPISQSPCTYHGYPECMYKTGPVVERLRKEAGIVDEEMRRRHSSRRKKRRRRRSSAADDREKSRDGHRH